MQPYQYGQLPPGPVAVSGRPIVVGAVGVVGCVVGLLLNAGSIAWVSLLIGDRGRDEPGGVGPSMLLAMQHLLMVVALLIALVLVSRRRDAGRSAALWIAIGDVPWLGLTVVALVFAYTDTAGGQVDHRVPGVVVVGLLGAAIALAGVGATVIGFGAPAGRRWLAEAVLVAEQQHAGAGHAGLGHAGLGQGGLGQGGLGQGGLGQGGPQRIGDGRSGPGLPRPLRATAWRFGLSAGLGVGGAVALVVLIPLSQLGQEEGAPLGILVFCVLLTLFVGTPVLLGTLGAWRARCGSRAGATTARVGGGFAVVGFPVFTLLGVFMVATSHYDPYFEAPEAPLPPTGVAVYGIVAVAASVVAFALYIAGLAGLADPRTRRHLAGVQGAAWTHR